MGRLPSKWMFFRRRGKKVVRSRNRALPSQQMVSCHRGRKIEYPGRLLDFQYSQSKRGSVRGKGPIPAYSWTSNVAGAIIAGDGLEQRSFIQVS